MKKLARNLVLCMQPVPQTIVSCRDKDGKNNALVVGFTANVSLDPATLEFPKIALFMSAFFTLKCR